MVKAEKDLPGSCPQQLSLLSGSAAYPEGALADLSLAVRTALVQAIKPCPLSRYEIAGRLSALLGRDISKTMLDKWTAESAEEHRIPAEVVVALCVVTDCTKPLEVLTSALGVRLVQPEEAEALELGRKLKQKAALDAEIKALARRRR